MNEKIIELAEEAGFVFWQNESWGPGPGHIDWSAIYDKEFQKYTELLINECIKELVDNFDMTIETANHIKEHFGIE